jgi:uncharacterized protein (TIGR02271 family)
MNGSQWNVAGPDGWRGRLIRFDGTGAAAVAEIETETGQRLRLPRAALQPQPGNTYRIDISPGALTGGAAPSAASTQAGNASDSLSVVEEKISIDKRQVETGEVAVHITPQTRQEVVDVELASEKVEVQRVPINRIVEAPAPPREEGDTTIVPVYEEIVVVEKKLVLKEEIHIRRRKQTRREQQTVAVRSEAVEVLRADAPQ